MIFLKKFNPMKKTLQIFTLFFVVLTYSQQISEFQYISIPLEFKDIKANKYDLNNLLAAKLKAKKYVIIKGNSPENINACELLKAEITDTSNMFTNKIKIDFRDCNEKSVSTFESKSHLKGFEEGMRDALEIASIKIPVSHPIKPIIQEESMPKSLPTELLKSPETLANKAEISTSIKDKSDITTFQQAEIYTNGKISVIKILLNREEFILVEPDHAIPYAIFKPSTKKETFRVQMSNGTSTLGYMENGKIVIELNNSDGSLRTEVFEKK